MASIFMRTFSLISYLMMIQQVSSGAGSKPAEKVSVDYYYESLCPYCANFLVNGLPIIFQNGLIDIVDLKLFPWGNAVLRSDNSIDCQHGPVECLLNTVEACAIDAWPDLNEHFWFIHCVESLAYEGKYTEWETCFEDLGLNPKPVTDCYTTAYGKQLQLKNAAATDALKPPLEYVPWVVVDGQPLYEDYGNFMSYICKAYKGPSPSACHEVSFDTVVTKKTDHHVIQPVCYPEEAATVPVFMKIRASIASLMRQMINTPVM